MVRLKGIRELGFWMGINYLVPTRIAIQKCVYVRLRVTF